MPESLWKDFDPYKYQRHITISTIDSATESKEDKRIVYMEDLEKRKQVYGICGECNEPVLLNEIKSHLHIYLFDVSKCYGMTQDPNSKEFMMVFRYCEGGNLRNYLNKTSNYIDFNSKNNALQQIARGLLDIHNVGLVHKDLHSGNILTITIDNVYDNKWDAEIKNRPTANELYQLLDEWKKDVKECDKIGKKKFKSRLNEDKFKNIQTHPQAIYTSRLHNFKNLPKPVNFSDLSSFQFHSDVNHSESSSIVSDCLDCKI
ncbi:kinase-like domain-containing protein [Rhizophagus clarus]|uniref:Kinase-like domain-containing protein n=1 Tax=Rhizophagus clarus TaxID=94130 RepID=A0A8H3LGI7_9GLOM|nr:kinase-like domain-containing protein [Rhizophagus clarus]